MGREMKVYRNKDGDIINIGEWEILKSIIVSEDGYEDELTINPIPEGSTITDEEVTMGFDGNYKIK